MVAILVAADLTIAGTMAALAFQGSLDEEDSDAPVDSAGVDFVTGIRLLEAPRTRERRHPG